MSIEIKRSIKPVVYYKAINELETRVKELIEKKDTKELIWFLEHPNIYTAGSGYNDKDVLDKSIKIYKTSRGGKITWHGPGQLICYFAIDLSKRKKDIRKFITVIENSIINSLDSFNINVVSDRKNIGLWHKKGNKVNKVAAIGIRVKKWIAYHGFSLNINNELQQYKKIIPCGIKKKEITNLVKIKKQSYKNITSIIEKNLISLLKN